VRREARKLLAVPVRMRTRSRGRWLKFDDNGSDRGVTDQHGENIFMIFQLRDVARGLVRHLVARFRRPFLCEDRPVYTLTEGLDYLRSCRQIDEPNSLEVDEWLSSGQLDLDESEFNTVSLH